MLFATRLHPDRIAPPEDRIALACSFVTGVQMATHLKINYIYSS
jgi:hypothetical protein